MPEYPDVQLYVERLQAKVAGRSIEALRVASPFVVRTFDPPISDVTGRTILTVHSIGKRLVFGLDDDRFLVIHLMIAGRLRWRKRGASHRARNVLAVFDFSDGSLVFTEASKKKRASIHLVVGTEALVDFDRGGLSVFDIDGDAFAERVRTERHTLKRTLTDPRLFSGIGNAYSDEILFRAQLSPVKMSTSLSDDEIARLFTACTDVLTEWLNRFREEIGDGFPDVVTAFRPEMNTHGRHKQPCRVCASPIQRIVHGDNETNYCATCQTGGKLLADRALSRLLKSDWPKTLEELEERRKG